MKGGAERVLADVTAGLVDQGHDVSVLSFEPPGGRSFYPLHGNIERICLGIGDTKNRAGVSETLARMKALRRAVKAEKPDAVVAFMHSMFVPMAFALAGTGVPVITSEHIVPEHYKARRFEFFLLLLSSFFVTSITVLSERVKHSYPRFLHKKMVAMPNPVHKAGQLADPAGADDERKIILNVGRLDPQKNQEVLVRAFAALASEFEDWDVRIVGEGALRGDLEELIAELNLEDRVFLPGTTADINAEYREAHIFALPSRYESFGLATAEAMAHGLPPTGFAQCPGTNELIIDGENGVLAEGLENIESFAKSLKTLMSAADLRVQLGAQARGSVERFAPESIARDWEALLKRVVSA